MITPDQCSVLYSEYSDALVALIWFFGLMFLMVFTGYILHKYVSYYIDRKYLLLEDLPTQENLQLLVMRHAYLAKRIADMEHRIKNA